MTNIHHEPRSRVVLRYTREAVKRKTLRVLPFSEVVADAYLAQVQPEDRTLRFKEAGDTVDTANKARAHNCQLVDRLIKGTSREFHCDLEEFWVRALPEPFRSDCMAELVRRYGFLGARPLLSHEEVVSHGIPGLAKEFGETMAALAGVIADGKIDATDGPLIRRALQEGTDLMAAWASIQGRLLPVLEAADAHGAAVET
jgi:hypothetical protein